MHIGVRVKLACKTNVNFLLRDISITYIKHAIVSSGIF